MKCSNFIQLNISQADVFFGQILDPSGHAYNHAQYTAILGCIDVASFEAAAEHVLASTEALRIQVIVLPDGEPGQRIRRDLSRVLTFVDLCDQSDPHDAALVIMQAELERPFDLAQEPLVRWQLLRIAPDRFYWFQAYHHIAIDAYGRNLIAGRLAASYSAILAGSLLPQWPDCLGEVLSGCLRYPGSGRQAEDRAYWRSELAGADPAQPWSGCPGLVGKTFTRQSVVLSGELTEWLRSAEGPDSGIWFLCAAAILQARYSRSADVILGVPINCRYSDQELETPGMMSAIGYLRLEMVAGRTISELSKYVLDKRRDIFHHGKFIYTANLREIGCENAAEYYALCVDVNQSQRKFSFGSCASEVYNLSDGPVSGLRLSVGDLKAGSPLRLYLDGNSERYTPEQVTAYLEQLVQCLAALGASEPASPLAALPLTPETDLAQIAAFNATDHAINAALVPDLFAQVAALTPDAVAMVWDDVALSYGALDAASSRLARYLILNGAGPERIVGLCFDRSVGMIVAILAVLKAGAAYLPLDPALPQERSRLMLADSGALVLVCEEAQSEVLVGIAPVIVPTEPATAAAIAACSAAPISDAERTQALHPDNLAYLIYTSGSTGKPKAVAMGHGCLANLLSWHRAYHPDQGATLYSSAVGFDVSVQEIFSTLTAGQSLIVVTKVDREHQKTLTIAAKGKAASLFAPMSMLELLSEEAGGKGEDVAFANVIQCGERLVLNATSRALLSSAHSVGNHYGPTETHVVTASNRLKLVQDQPASIGSPIWNTQIHILDTTLAMVPVGVWGEIYIAGAGLARGYAGRAGLTAERFVACPYGAPGERMYRTGDLGRWQADGTIEFGGRADDQVKLRGFRIEPGEIAAVLGGVAGIGQAAVVVREVSGEQRLVAYVTATPGIALPDPATIRKELSALLPEYMIPMAFVQLDALPLTVSGKLDRKALPLPDMSVGVGYVPPSGETEIALAQLWAEALGIDRIGRHDNFFELGGHSLLAMRLLARMEGTIGRKLALGELFNAPTIALFTQSLEDSFVASDLHSIVPLAMHAAGPPIFMIHLIERDLARHLGASIPVYGLSFGLAAAGLSTPVFPKSIEALAAHYIKEMRTVQPVGPYRIIGHSLGGMIAYEMAQQLQRMGETPTFLGLLDTYFLAHNLQPRRLRFSQSMRNLAIRLSNPVPEILVVCKKVESALKSAFGSETPGVSHQNDIVEPLFRFLEDPYEADFYTGPVHLFMSSDSTRSLRFEAPETTLRNLVVGELHVSKLPGGHMDMVKDPVAGQTSAMILGVIKGQVA